jgi:hypothetical protein
LEKSPQTRKAKSNNMKTTNQTLLAWAAPTSSFFNKRDKGDICGIGAPRLFAAEIPRGVLIPAVVGDWKMARATCAPSFLIT